MALCGADCAPVKRRLPRTPVPPEPPALARPVSQTTDFGRHETPAGLASLQEGPGRRDALKPCGA